ncbi:PACE efflux transporter [Shewanella sp. DC2-4]|nr:PACE efflux transporter [Shewanella sp. DC2-4]
MPIVYRNNIGVDRLQMKYQGHIHKTLCQRVLHTFGFVASLLIIALPIMSWWLNVSLLEALVLDLGFVAFYLVYAFIYNWGYDKVFPIPKFRRYTKLGTINRSSVRT